MKQTQKKDFIRLIKASGSRFASILAIVMLGVAFFVGVSAISTVMAHSVDVYDDALSLKDITVYSNYGFDDADREALLALPEVEAAEGSIFVDVYATNGTRTEITRIHAYDDKATINQFVLKDGRLPENDHEALAESGTDLVKGFAIGETLTFSRPDGDLPDYLHQDTATVVGLIDTPLYLNETKENSTLSNQYIKTYLYLPRKAFVPEYDTELNVLITGGKELGAFSDAYYDRSAAAKEAIETLGVTQAEVRKAEIVAEAMEAYEEGLTEYEEGLRTFEEKIREVETELQDADRQIQEGEEALEEGKQTLLAGEETLAKEKTAGEERLAQAEQVLAEGKAAYEAGLAEYEAAQAALPENLRAIDEAIASLTEAQEGLAKLAKAKEVLTREEISRLADAITALPDSMQALSVDELLRMLEELTDAVERMKEVTDLPDETVGTVLDRYEETLSYADKDGALLAGSEALAIYDVARALPEATELSESILSSMDSYSAVFEAVKRWNPERTIGETGTFCEGYDAALVRIARTKETLQTESVTAIIELLAGADPSLSLSAFSKESLSLLRSRMKELNELLPEGDSITTIGDFAQQYPRLLVLLEEKIETIRTALTEQGADPDHIDEAIEALRNTKAAIPEQLTRAREALEAAAKEITDGEAALREGRRTYAEQIRAAGKELADGWSTIAEKEALLEEAKHKYADGMKTFAEEKLDGESELNKAKAKLDKALQDIRELEEGSWTVLDRTMHYASETYRNTIAQMKAIANIFPVFFLMVAALVCLTTMSRMITEMRGQIGIVRALGYTRFMASKKYLLYAGTATLLGIVLGAIAGIATFPAVIYHTWRMMYILPKMLLAIPWGLIAFTAAAFLGMMLFVTWRALWADMKEVPSQLLRPKAPSDGKRILLERIPALWKRLSFTDKVTVRNLFRYKKRFIMTVAGVAGCCALLVTGFGIRDSLNTMIDVQFSEIMHTDVLLTLEDSVSFSEAAALEEEIAAMDETAFVVRASSYSALSYDKSGRDETVYAQVFSDTAAMEAVYTLRTREGHNAIVPDDEGVIITEKFSENFGLAVGDTFVLESENGLKKEVTVSAIMEMYIHHYVLMTDAYYRAVFGTDAFHDTLFVKAEGSTDALLPLIAAMPEIESVSFYEETLDNFRTMVEGIDAVVWVLILSSMSLAFVVLGNLTNVNISERVREIATLKVLGFRPREVETYIFKENNILTAIGALCGIPVGIPLHRYIMGQVEMNYIMFGRSVNLLSLLYSVLLTVLFGLIVNFFMRKNLREVKMVESLKSVE